MSKWWLGLPILFAVLSSVNYSLGHYVWSVAEAYVAGIWVGLLMRRT